MHTQASVRKSYGTPNDIQLVAPHIALAKGTAGSPTTVTQEDSWNSLAGTGSAYIKRSGSGLLSNLSNKKTVLFVPSWDVDLRAMAFLRPSSLLWNPQNPQKSFSQDPTWPPNIFHTFFTLIHLPAEEVIAQSRFSSPTWARNCNLLNTVNGRHPHRKAGPHLPAFPLNSFQKCQ